MVSTIEEKTKKKELEKQENLEYDRIAYNANLKAIEIEQQMQKTKAELDRAVKEFNIIIKEREFYRIKN